LIGAGVDVVHGHSSHHPRPIEVVEGKLVLYGCGDFVDDYEGISGREEFRGDLVLMYFADVDPSSGRLVDLSMTPMRIRQFRLHRASPDEARWLRDTINREREPRVRIPCRSGRRGPAPLASRRATGGPVITGTAALASPGGNGAADESAAPPRHGRRPAATSAPRAADPRRRRRPIRTRVRTRTGPLARPRSGAPVAGPCSP
jgi:hypothetical protein